MAPFLKRYSGLLAVVALACGLFIPLSIGYVRDAMRVTSNPIPVGYDLHAQRAMQLVKTSEIGRGLEKNNPAFRWKNDRGIIGSSALEAGRIFVICYCNERGDGWRWEVNVETGSASLINGSPALESKYGLRHLLR